MPSNTAAWQTAAKVKPLEVKPAAYTPPGDNEIVVKNAAVAINPIDWSLQDFARFPLNYPAILGQDLAGEVVEVGASVSRFSKGDRVLGNTVTLMSKKECHGAFQEYTVVLANMASPIPSTLSFERAAVIPLGLATASAGMFQKGYLELQYPSTNPNPTGKALLIWGGASSVGSNAIQLAVAAGYEVITTASPKNFDYVKKLGASQAINYKDEAIVDKLVNAFKGKTIAGALDTIGIDGAVHRCADVVGRSDGNKLVSTVKPLPEKLPSGVNLKWVFATTIKDNEVSKVIFEDFLPKALAEGKFVAAPDPYVVGKGLERVQEGFEAQKKGMSAKKVVITL